MGERARCAIDELGDGRVLLLENLRFHAGEERNDPDFSKALAALADIYVNDAFGTAHRAHASTAGMAAHFDRVAAGDLMDSELRHLRVIREPIRPLLVILGGAKVSDKLSVLEALAPHADVLAIGGAMAYTFIAANGGTTGNSLVEPDRFGDALAVQRAASRMPGGACYCPATISLRIASKPMRRHGWLPRFPRERSASTSARTTASRYASEAAQRQDDLLERPDGRLRDGGLRGGHPDRRDRGRRLARDQRRGRWGFPRRNQPTGLGDRIDHLSTGGGASLEYVQGLKLPGVDRTGAITCAQTDPRSQLEDAQERG